MKIESKAILAKVHKRNPKVKELVSGELFDSELIGTAPKSDEVDMNYYKLEFIRLDKWIEYIHDSAYEQGIYDA